MRLDGGLPEVQQRSYVRLSKRRPTGRRVCWEIMRGGANQLCGLA